MHSTLRRLTPLLLWSVYLAGYPWIVGLVGSYAPLVGLVPVAVSGWMFGAAAGLLAGLLGYFLVQGRLIGLGMSEWRPTAYLTIEHLFPLLAYAGIGLVTGWLNYLQHNLRHARAVSLRARLDPLTGTLTRATFEERLQRELANAEINGGGLALLFVDLDRFKFVNDTYGHDVGDKLLREVGRLLRENVRTNDLVGRVGGDEFMVALVGVTDEAAAGQVARGLVRELGAPVLIERRELQVSASIGISLFPRDGRNSEELLHSADAAMYEVKERGKNAFHFSTLEVRTRISRRLELERKLRRALAENELEIVYQPQVRLADSSIVGFEALLRWRSPELGTISPGEFIPVAEEAGLIGSIGHWTLRESAMQLMAWQRSGLMPVRMAVNVSTLQFHQSTFVDTVKGALSDSGIDPALLEIELTENVLVRDHELAMRTLFRLERLGVRTALDDFGTGYSSLAYLQQLPIGTLKIDRSFIQSLTPPPLGIDVANFEAHSRSDAASGTAGGASGSTHSRLDPPVSRQLHGAAPIVEAIIAMAHKLGKELVAEGIETAYQRDYVRRLKVDVAQGYFYSRPLTPLKAEELLRRVTKRAIKAARSTDAAANSVPLPLEQGALAPLQAAQRSRRDDPNITLDDLLLWD